MKDLKYGRKHPHPPFDFRTPRIPLFLNFFSKLLFGKHDSWPKKFITSVYRGESSLYLKRFCPGQISMRLNVCEASLVEFGWGQSLSLVFSTISTTYLIADGHQQLSVLIQNVKMKYLSDYCSCCVNFVPSDNLFLGIFLFLGYLFIFLPDWAIQKCTIG